MERFRDALCARSQFRPFVLRLIGRLPVAAGSGTCADRVMFIAPTGPTHKCRRPLADLEGEAVARLSMCGRQKASEMSETNRSETGVKD
jgi:hypothetical protein